MEHLNMHTPDITESNILKIGELFPNCLTERISIDGKVESAIDFDMLRQELSKDIVESPTERYQFTWPEKRKAIRLANAPTNMTLRPCREESVDFDNTENLYIEGDNLEVLKLLRENYLGKVKMIYIDPPYNTGKDFVYADDYSQSASEYADNSGQRDELGNRLVLNAESNGRFHTDWLNMIYPRLRIAKDLLSDSGAIFIHIDEHEVYSLQMICKEIFGSNNELGTIIWDKRNPKGVVAGVAYQHESVLVFCKNIVSFAGVEFSKKKEHADEMLARVQSLIRKYGGVTDQVRNEYKDYIKKNKNEFSGGEVAYSLIDDAGRIYQPVSMAAPDKPETRSHRPLIHPKTGKPCPVPDKGWRFTDSKMDELVRADKIEFGPTEQTQPRQKYYLRENMNEAVASLLYYGGSDDALGLPFDNPKPVYVAKKIIGTLSKNQDDIILDFFSGSATTAHAVMLLNKEDGLRRKFILVQLPEETAPKSPASKAGFSNICEIGKERIRRARKQIILEQRSSDIDNTLFAIGEKYQFLDVGFRVLKLDSSNMEDVYYRPEESTEKTLFEDNIKPGRTSEDLLFQVMLECNLPLSAKIETEKISGKEVFSVNDGYLIACFDEKVNEDVIKEVAKRQPYYFVMRDSSLATDNVADNFEQIFQAYSKDTIRRVL
jgi:adenine-specific DNA-methyltransferase